MSTVNVNVTKIEKDVTINATPNVTQIIVTTQSGGGGVSNLELTANSTNNVVSNSNGTGFTIPLADETNAGLITATEKSKLAGIEAGAEVNVKADWNAITGDSEILNKPTIPSITGLVAKSDYTPAHSLLVQQNGTGSPTSVAIGTNEILGRLSGGGSDIEGLSTTQVKTLLDLSGTNTGDNANNTTSNAYADAKVTDAIVDGVTTIAPSQNAVFDALNLKVDKASWIDYSITSTVVGFSSFTAKEIRYIQGNKQALFLINISGVSNAQGFTFTIPFTAINTIIYGCQVINNSADQAALGVIYTTAGSNVIRIRTNGSFSNFASTGNKGVATMILIETT